MVTPPALCPPHPARCWGLPVPEDMGLDLRECNARRFYLPIEGQRVVARCYDYGRRALSEGRCAC